MNENDKLLIITSKKDTHADYLINECYNRGYNNNVVRLNTEDFIHNSTYRFDGSDFDIYIEDSGRTVSLKEVKSVWYRRPESFELHNVDDSDVKKFIKEQGTEWLRGIYFCLHDNSLWVNPLPSLHRSRHKLQQLRAADHIGLKTPRTLATNNPDDVIDFVESVEKVCIKSLGEPNYFRNGTIQPWMTKVLDKQDVIERIDSVGKCPVFFQEYIDKSLDIRVTVVDDDVFATEIHSQDHPKSSSDFRGVAPHLLEHNTHELPSSVTSNIIQFVRQQGLVYAAIDLVLTNNDEYIFIENNPNGQYLWTELATDVSITDALIDTFFQ